MDKKRIKTLLDKYRRGTLSGEERAFLESWYARYQEQDGENYDAEQLLEDSALVREGLRRSVTPVRKKRFLRFAAAAAAVFIALAAGLYFYQGRPLTGNGDQAKTGQDIRPGGNKAMLTLGDGTSIELSTEKKGIDAGAGRLVYHDGTAVGHSPVYDSLTTRYAVLATPRGGQYQVCLPDGTKVWLNAASSLEYPESFAGLKERRVILRGEAYFEVAEDKGKPFLVSTEKQSTEVLGTHFNINAYPDGTFVKTTLLEGSLMVRGKSQATRNLPARPALPTGRQAQNTKRLKPGQEATFSEDRITVEEVDTDEAVAWKNGYFQFHNKNLETAMTEVARWYDIEVVYGDQARRELELAGTISKYADISQVLKKMELTGVIRFSIAGRKIIVE